MAWRAVMGRLPPSLKRERLPRPCRVRRWRVFAAGRSSAVARSPIRTKSAAALWRAHEGTEFATIPAGSFIYGPEETYERQELAPPPRPRQTIELDTFHLAVRPVTYARWKAFLD